MPSNPQLTKHLFSKLWHDGVQDECEQEEDLRDDEQGGGELGRDDLKYLVVGGNVVIYVGAHSGNDAAQLLAMGHLTMTILVENDNDNILLTCSRQYW